MNERTRIRGGTRGRILGLLRRSDRTVAELAEALGISDNAVRTHLLGLERDGLVAAGPATRVTGGKPAQEYGLTAEGRELFPRAYALFLTELIGRLEAKGESAWVKRLLRETGRRVAEEQGTPEGELRERVESAAAVLRMLGGDVEVEATSSGYRIRGFGCPLAGVVSAQPRACLMAEAFVAAMVGAPVTERCEKGERPRCAFEVSA